MAKKLFSRICLLWTGMLFLTFILFIGILYGASKSWTFTELEQKAALAAQGMDGTGVSYLEKLGSEDRFTWIAADGTVLYDNFFDAETMENHAERAEVREALERGKGKSVHQSAVLLENTLYYAKRMQDGTILRISCVQSVADLMLYPLLMPMLGILALAIVLSGLLSYRVAHRILRRIEEIDLDHPEKNQASMYPELRPFLQRIEQQNRTIQQQMQKIRQRKQEFSVITENMSEGFILTDNQANVLTYNTSARKLLDREPDENGRCALHESKRFRDVTSAALCGKRMEQRIEVQERCCQLIASPVVQNGQVKGAVIVILDITEKEQRDRLRRDFSANVSHELKTPLTSISGFAEIIRDGLTDADTTREFAGDIYKESQRMIALINDIIRLSELDEGRLEQEKEAVDLYEIARNVVEQMQPIAQKADISLQLKGKTVCIPGVRQILEEMVFNLCDNAIKYNRPDGTVRVEVQKNTEKAILRVEDTGIGIPNAVQSRVFERFYRVDKSHSRAIGGTGLGLSIVKHGAACHQADIRLESEEGKGTVITVLFPLTRI